MISRASWLASIAAGAILLMHCVRAAGQAVPPEAADPAPLFSDHAVIDVTIEAPLTTLRTVRSDEEYLDGRFSYTTADGESRSFDLRLRTRGRFRLQEATCNFPPVRLNFKKKQVEDTLFDGQDKLKLVTHCQQNKPSYEQLVLREYLAYRFLQALTDYSFRVRLMRINWVDTESDDTRVKVGFVIEDDDDVADRLGMTAKKTPNFTIEDLVPEQRRLAYVYQYMIGNTDYSLIHGADENDCCHNSVPMTATGGPPYMPVPYDFDFAGLVNAPYAIVDRRFPISNVRQRLYRGRCVDNEHLPELFSRFREKREEFTAILGEPDMLSGRTRRDVTSYLDRFYRDISDPERIEKQFIDRCN
jgi:hypothetical protein